MFKNSNVHMDPGKGKGSEFGSIYYIGSDHEEKKEDTHKMRVVDLCRPMTVGYILLLITAINISMTVYLVKSSACTVTTSEPREQAVSHWPWLLEDRDSRPQTTSWPVSKQDTGREGGFGTLEDAALALRAEDNNCWNYTTSCVDCSSVRGCVFIEFDDGTQSCMTDNANTSDFFNVASTSEHFEGMKFSNPNDCPNPISEESALKSVTDEGQESCWKHRSCEQCTSEHRCAFLVSQNNQICIPNKVDAFSEEIYVTPDECPTDAQDSCLNYSSCEQCASRHGCMFVVYSDMSICMSDNATRDSEVLLLVKYLNPEECASSGEPEMNTIASETSK